MADSRYCCDLHHPERFERVPPPPPKRPSNSRHSRLPQGYKRPLYTPLLQRLHTWRREEAKKRYGQGRFSLYGGGLVLPDEVAGRIVDLAYLHKIRSLNDLKHEIEWKDITRYAAQIWPMVQAYVHQHLAAVAAATAALSFSSVQNKVANANSKAKSKPKTSGTRRCGACGTVGHYSKFSTSILVLLS